MVPDAIANTLGLVVQGRQDAQDALARGLGDRNMLIVLDNFEQVSDAAPVIADLLRRAPELHLLVTSRVVLHIRGEREWRVDPLAVPPEGATLVELERSPSVQLLVERVRDADPGFELTTENAAAVGELCRRLEGLPLALELAAGWLRLLTPEQMLKRLFERLESRGSLVDLPDRQQTLTDTIEWSYDLIAPECQRLLTRLSVFGAPFTAEAVEAVCGSTEFDAVEGLSRLLDSSMVSPADRPDGQRGFRLLDAIRRFASARLENVDETYSRLEHYLLDVLRGASDRQASQAPAMLRLDSEQSNLQAVIAWMARTGRPSGELLRAIGDVWVWLMVRGHLRHSSQLWQRIESLPDSGLHTTGDRVALSWLKANRLLSDGYFAECTARLDEILPDARRTETPSRLAFMLGARGISRPYSARARTLADFDEALNMIQEVDDPLTKGYVLSHYGLLLGVIGETQRARAMHDQMLAIAQALDDVNLRAEAHYDARSGRRVCR